MGIPGFYLWLMRHYYTACDKLPPNGCIQVDNLYLDMNGLVHPCCHDTAPMPPPDSEEEMMARVFEKVDELVAVTRPRKVLMLAVDGVAPRSKLNQQRARRFRAADEGMENSKMQMQVTEDLARRNLPAPTWKKRWDHNVITPATPFMEKLSVALEWYIYSRVNSGDENWKHLSVIYSGWNVPGEGEHKIMEFVRGIRRQKGYDVNTHHCIFGLDADLICLGLATHEVNFTVLRNQMDRKTFQHIPHKFEAFRLVKFRQFLKGDYAGIPDMDFERILDDFVFLCFFVGNDFLPHMPLVAIRAKGIELMLDHYVKEFTNFGGYLTKNGEVHFGRLALFLSSFHRVRYDRLVEEFTGDARAEIIVRAKVRVLDNLRQMKQQEENLEALISENAPLEMKTTISNSLAQVLLSRMKEERRVVAGEHPTEMAPPESKAHRDDYYKYKLGWDPTNREQFEQNIRNICQEYLRGMVWVLRYYTSGCPSWDWFYPFYYAPLLEDLAKHCDGVPTEFNVSAPLAPVEQLLAVLPRESVQALPEQLHESVVDTKSPLAQFYPSNVDVDFTEAIQQYQGVIKLPFLDVGMLQKEARRIGVSSDELFEGQQTFTAQLFMSADNPISDHCEYLSSLSADGEWVSLLPDDNGNVTPQVEAVAGVACGYIQKDPYAAPVGEKYKCKDRRLAKLLKRGDFNEDQPIEVRNVLLKSPVKGYTVENNRALVYCLSIPPYERYRCALLPGAKEEVAYESPRQQIRRKENFEAAVGEIVNPFADDSDEKEEEKGPAPLRAVVGGGKHGGRDRTKPWERGQRGGGAGSAQGTRRARSPQTTAAASPVVSGEDSAKRPRKEDAAARSPKGTAKSPKLVLHKIQSTKGESKKTREHGTPPASPTQSQKRRRKDEAPTLAELPPPAAPANDLVLVAHRVADSIAKERAALTPVRKVRTKAEPKADKKKAKRSPSKDNRK